MQLRCCCGGLLARSAWLAKPLLPPLLPLAAQPAVLTWRPPLPARLAPSSQAQLAQMINEKPQLINEYESGKAIPNPQVRPGVGRGM